MDEAGPRGRRRTFSLAAKELVPHTRLVWGDGKRQRVFEIQSNTDGTVTFSMRERIGGVMFLLCAAAISSFDACAGDLKKAAPLVESQRR